MVQFGSSHGTQTAYCITGEGKIRVWIEHWHGNISPPNVVNALVSIDVFDSSTGITTNYQQVPDGVVWDTPVGSLPDCKGPLTVLSSCPGRANVYNDWVYWEFSPPACFVNLAITIVEVVGSQSWYFDEACAALYPVSFTDNFIDCAPPSMTCPTDKSYEALTGCVRTITDGLQPAILFDDCTPLEDIILTYDVTGATTGSGTGPAHLTYNKGTSTVTYTAEDNTGKTSTCDFTVTVDDTTPPNIVCPSNLTIECDESGKGALISQWLSLVTTTDNCGVNSITNNFSGTNGLGTINVTFTATDNCGNVSTCQASINIVDTTDPVISCPSNIVLECSAVNFEATVTNWLNNATAIDVCEGPVDVTHNYVASFPGGCDGPTGTRTVTFTAVDASGNSTNCTATITVVDTTPPEFLMKPQDITVECINTAGNAAALNAWLATNGGGMAQDDCDPTVTWTRTTGSTTDLCGYTFSREYTFTITDNCGNSASTTATFTVEDTTSPIMNAPVDRTINCNTASNQTTLNIYLNQGSATDACSLNSVIDISYILNSHEELCGGTYIETYLYTATDECGNTATDLFTFEVRDVTPPTWASPPGTLILECGDEDNPTIITEWVDAFEESIYDTCDDDQNIIIENNWDGTLTEGCNRNTTIIWTVTDDCGNARTLSRVIAVRDTQNPTFLNCPDDFTVNVDVDVCGSIVTFPTPVAFDQCTPQNELTITQINGPASGSTFPVGTTFVRFRVRDGCNRQGLCSFFITVADTDTPSINCPSNVEACTRPNLCYWTSDTSVDPITADNCNGLTVQFELSGATVLSRRNGTARNRNFNIGTTEVCYWLNDSNGNESTCCFDVIVSDCQDPVISCPNDITNAACGSSLPAAFNAAATDNCSSAANITITRTLYNTISGCGGTDTEVYVFVATDEAGNSSQCFASFTTIDNVNPVITTSASNGSSNCTNADIDFLSWLNNNGGAVASDACGDVSWSYDFVGTPTTGCSGAPSANVIFTVTDDCGNTASSQASFSVPDNTDPTINCPEDLTLECGDALNDSVIQLWLNSASGEDNCSEVTITNDFKVGTSLSCGESVTVTFTATDDCGNDVECEATITIEDNANPVIVIQPQDLYLTCGDAGNASQIAKYIGNNAGAEFYDSCSANDDLTITVTEIADATICGNAERTDYRIVITDECDNSVQAEWSIFIEDNTPPNLAAISTLTLECDGSGNTAAIKTWLDAASATDECGSVSVVSALWNSSNSCGDFENYTYLFTATDECGNQSTSLADVVITDSTDPNMSCPSDLVLSCGATTNPTLIANWLTSTTASDNCSNVTVSHNYTGLLPANCGGELTVTFVATDACGNTSSCMADIILNDVISPDFVNCPEDMTINVDVSNCGSNPIFSTPIAVDNCGVTVTQTTGPASGTPFPIGPTTVGFTATDECGNTATCEFVITVVDSQDPLILCPGDLFDRCITDGTCALTINDIAPVLGQENCPGFNITYAITGATSATGVNDASGTSFNLGNSTVCYTLTDAASNTSMCCFDIQVLDCTPPTLTCPSDLVVNCDGSGNVTDLNTWLASVSSMDACSAPVTLTNRIDNTISGCGDTYTVVYEFTATDAVGNETVCYASFGIQDVTLPIIMEDAEDLTVECDGANNSNDIQSWLNSFGGAEATDGCGDVTFSHDFSGNLSDDCGGTGDITVVFTATDDCGNTATTSAVFTIEDTTAPALSCPTSIQLECGDAANDAIVANWISTASASDACSNVVFTNDFATSFSGTCGDAGSYTVTFTATDECGNSTTCEKVITVTDSSVPTFSQTPTDLELECADANNATLILQWLTNNGNGIATDECGSVAWSYVALDALSSCGNTETIPYVFTITDECGLSSTAMANVITTDNIVPAINVPDAEVVECDGSGNTTDLDDWLAEISGSDTCGDVTTSYVLNNTISACGGGEIAEYIFTVTDACGNSSTGVSSFTIEDMTVPIIACPSDLSLECGDIGNDQTINAWLLSATSSDVCSSVSISHDYNGTLPADCNGSVTVEFTATDACGNTSTCTADILMDDTTDPIFVSCPDDLTINVDVDACGSNPIFSTPIAEDNCTVSVAQVANINGDLLVSGTTFPVGTTEIVFVATDACGNTVECVFDIIVIDSDVPQIFCPSNTVTQCADTGRCTWTSDNSVAPSTSFENCDDYTIVYTISGTTNSSGSNSAAGVVFNIGLSTVCYVITDQSDNSSQCCFDVLIEDCEAPLLVCPNDLIVECANSNALQLNNWLNSTVSSDNCDLAATVTFQLYNTTSGCGGSYSEEYLITATDAAGNATTCIRSFEIQDNVAPVINTAVSNVTVECNGNGNLDQLISWLENNGNISDSDVSEFCSAYNWNNNFNQVSFTNIDPCSDDIGFYDVQFWVMDECGNESNRITKRFSIEDTTDPELTVPDPITLVCGEEVNAAIISSWENSFTASDLCDVSVSVVVTNVVVEQCGETNTTTYTFTATDACGNEVDEVSTITIIDNVAPTILVEATDLMLECDDAGNAAAISAWENLFGGAQANDNCSDEDLDWSILSETITSNCGDTQSTLYVFEVEDNCGNTSTTSASVIITDTTNPILTVPENQTEECSNISTSLSDWLAEASSTDECGDVAVTNELWNTVSGCGGTESQTYLFTATDACGNVSTGFADYILEDTTDPNIVCPADLVLECGDEENDQLILAWLASASSVDEFNCSEVVITHDYPNGLPNPLSCNSGTGIDVTFKATDACGNSSECTRNISMSDTEVPYFVNCPSNLIVNVDVDLCETNVVYSTPIALDNCDEQLTVVQTAGPASGTAFPLGASMVTFEATDDCGNVSTCTFQITVIDSDTPSIECPSNDVVKCADTDACIWTSDDDVDPMFNDNCSDIQVEYVITGATNETSAAVGINKISEDGIEFQLGTSTVCYTITDGSANTDQCCFDVIVEDCQSPSLTCSDELNIACGAEDVSTWINTIANTAMDNCDALADLTVDALLLTDISSCGNTFERVYLFTVTDQAGNTSTCTATYETDDAVVPAIDTEAANLTLECTNGNQSSALQAWLNNNGGASASDVCSGPIAWTNDFDGDLTGSCGTNGGVTVVFTATDECGNTSTTAADFTIEDNTSPTLTLPNDITLECSDASNMSIIENWLNSASAEDVCQGTLAVEHDFDTAVQTDECGLTGTTTITFEVEDACGNTSTDTRDIVVVDNTSPEITAEPSNLILECADSGNDAAIAAWELAFGGSDATDSCSDEDLVWSILNTFPVEGCGDTQSTLYVFQVVDNCDNTSTTSASVIVEDNTDPILTLPDAETVECNDPQVTLADWLAEATATDLCGDATVTYYLNNTTSACGGTYSDEYIFIATDECGNTTTGSSTYTLEDTTDPEIMCPEDLIIVCGNSSNDLIISNWLNSATASDPNECSTVSISFTDPGALPALSCAGDTGSTITWTATDECGNTSTCDARIIMIDNIDPVFTNCPPDLTIAVDVDVCTSNPIFSTPIAEDNCNVTVQQVANAAGNLLTSGSSFPLGTTEIVFIATDDCGNTSACIFDITVLDTDEPIVLCPSSTLELSTDEGVCTWTSDDRVSTAFSVENCPDQTLTYTITGATSATGSDNAAGEVFELGTSTVCYTLEDASGNSSTCCFDVIVTDNELPQFECPSNVVTTTSIASTGDCSADVDWFHPVVTDNCDLTGVDQLELIIQHPDFNIEGPSVVIPGAAESDVFDLGQTTLTYFAYDANGNSSSCQWTVVVTDDEVPMITCTTDQTFEINDECSYTELSDQLDPSFSDNCEIDVVVHDYVFGPFNNTLEGASFDIGTTTVTWTAVDASGNTSTCSYDVTIVDTASPEFVNCPQDTLTVGNDVDQCSAFVNWSDPIAQDECGVSVTQTTGPNSGAELAPGFYTITYVATDNNGNTSSCEFVIHVLDTQMPIVLCPSNDVEVNTDEGTCEWDSPIGSLTPTTALTNCPFDLTWTVTNPDATVANGTDDVSGYVFQLGTSIVCYDIIEQEDPDNNGLLSDQCCFNVIVTDLEAPQITCPESVEIVTSQGGTGDCEAEYSWNHPSPTDNCGVGLLVLTITGPDGNEISSSPVTAGGNLVQDFALGTTILEYEVEDENGNISTCKFTITVVDDENPMITCVADMTLEVDADCVYVVEDDALDATSSDNCNVNSIYHDYIFAPNSNTLAGAKFELGTTVVTWTVIDDFGNSATCETEITIIDTVDPEFINCPTDLTIAVDVDACTSNPIFSTPIAEDNCDVTVQQVPNTSGDLLASGTPFPLGTTEVIFIATDAAGNTSACIFEITVIDTDEPIVLCPSNTVEISTDEGVCTWMSDDRVSTSFSVENCPDQTLTYEITGVTMATGSNSAAGEIFELGRSTVCYTLEDASGNSSMCCFDVVVLDNELPQFECPENQTIQTSDVIFGDCLSDLDWTHPLVTDNCSLTGIDQLELIIQSPSFVLNGPSVVTAGAATNSSFELGTSILTYIAYDANGNTSTCQWTVTVEDDEAPQLICPLDQTFEINNECMYTELSDQLDPTFSDNCEIDIVVHDYIFGPFNNTLEGASFDIGTTTVTWTAIDASGNTSTCAFDVTIVDTASPEFVNCPQDTLTVGNDVDQCSAFVNWSDPIAIDECGVSVTQTTGPNSGAELAPGFYTITYVATDNNGNTSSCEFVIHVMDTQMPIVLCPSNDVSIDTDEGTCVWESPSESLTATTALTNCPFDLSWTVTNPDASVVNGTDDVSGYVFQLGTSVVCYDIIEQEDPDNNGLLSDQCCFNVIVSDNENPNILCPDNETIVTSLGGEGDCEAEFSWDHPVPTDNCGVATLALTIIDPSGSELSFGVVTPGNNETLDFQLGTTILEYQVEDDNGNINTCVFTITVVDDEDPMINCVSLMTFDADANCQFVTTDAALDATFTDNCNVSLHYHDYIFAPNSNTLAGAEFELGTTTIVWTVIDDFGNSATCEHDIIVVDNTPPTIVNCPASDIVQDADGLMCQAIVNFSNIAAVDNCGSTLNIEYMLAGEVTQGWISGQASGIMYPVGTTTVSYRATDVDGNVSEVCEFDIAVLDNMAPEAICMDIEIGVDFNCMASITPEDIDAGSTDNCGIESLLISEDGTNFFTELEFNTEDLVDPFVNITLQVTDIHGNVSICQSTVFIVDEIDPMVICRDDIIVQTEPGVCYAMVPNVIPPIDTTDNCMGIANVRQEPLPGLIFGSEVGDSMFVTVIVEDEAGNMDSCQVKLVIEDNEIPQFDNCPRPPVTVAAETDLCSAAANFSVPTGSDNCGIVEIRRLDDTGLNSGDWFPKGTTILEYEIKDGSGNADTCHIKVVVNDLQPPSLTCPEDVVQVNDPGECGAIVKDIDPEDLLDNCLEGSTVTFGVDWEGERDNGGVISASGEFFQVGNNVVTYCIEDRPTLLISEVTHEIGAAIGTNSIPAYFDADPTADYIEITNVGPTTVDASCLVIEKLIGSTGGFGSFVVPFGIMIAPGQVMVIHIGDGVDSPADLYFNMSGVGGSQSGDAAGYAIMYGECIFDVVALNGFSPVGAGDLLTIAPTDWNGVIGSDIGTAGVYRPFTFDSNTSVDWAVVDADNPGTIGKVNQDFDTYPANDEVCSLQSKCGTKVCCTFTVEIFDVEPPMIECPANVSINTSDNGTGDCLSSTSWKHPDVTDNCAISGYCMTITSPDGSTLEDCTIVMGETIVGEFEVGETVVEYEVVDPSGNKSTCSFIITVIDDEDPEFVCPDDMFIQLDQGQCFIEIFNQINLFESDNCGDMIILTEPNMEGQFSEGENVVTIIIEDEAGNQRTCSFMITVQEYQPMSTEMACSGVVNVSLDANCEATITAEMILSDTDIGCADDLEIIISESHGGDPIPTSPMVNGSHIGQTLIVTIFNPATGNSCWGTILIEDKLNPIIECPMDVVVSCAEGVNPAAVGMPMLLSCEGSVDMIYSDEIIDNGLCGVPRAIHTRTWIVTDESGNSSTCQHTITVERLEASDITYPLNWDGIDNPELDCDAVANDPSLVHPLNTGKPTINGSDVLDAEYCPLSINMIDEVFHLCDGSFDILRTWRVYDPCKPVDKTGIDPNPIHSIQVIKVRDNTAPVLTCPADLVVSVGDMCRAEITFPAVGIVEACGSTDVQVVSPFGSLNTNGGVIGNIAVGNFTVRYIVTDGCGNQSECSIDIEVVDEEQPVVVCNPDVIVSLNNTGIAEVDAMAFDAGSTDNCTLDRVEVRRMEDGCGIPEDLEFGNTVTFCCADVGTNVMVQLRAFDAVGNFNDCMIEVFVDDKQDALITCPMDIIIDCGSQDYKDVSITGEATFTDNCTGNLGVADYSDEEFVDQCGNGFVLRTWTVDAVSCVQRIDLLDPEPFVINDTSCSNDDPNDGVIWPCDVEVESCSVMQDPTMSGEPQIFDDNCSLVGVEYTDQVFTFEDGACFKILRTWKVIDWCTHDANAGTGYWEYDQVIKIINSLPPVFTTCDELEFCISDNLCETEVNVSIAATDDCTDALELNYSYQLDIDNDGSFNLTGSGNSITQTLLQGVHSILWTVEDGCGNQTSCTQMIRVKDCKAPTAYCINGLSISLDGGTGTVSIWASDFNNGSTDNCTSTADLQISFSSDVTHTSETFSCSDIPNGQSADIVVQMWVTDADGNQSFCNTVLQVQDVDDACPDVTLLTAEIAGRVMTSYNDGVEDVMIYMDNMTTGDPYQMMSDSLGMYHFAQAMPTENQYLIAPFKDDDDRNGVTAIDLLGIQKHLLSIEEFSSPYKMIAADIDSSGHLSAVDLIGLQKLLLGIHDKFPKNTSWLFVDAAFFFPDLESPWPFPEEREIDSLMTNEMNENFIAIKVGDVNGSATTNLTSSSVDRREVLGLLSDDVILPANKEIKIPIYINQNVELNALSFTIESKVKGVEILDVESQYLQLDNNSMHLAENGTALSMVWFDTQNAVIKNGQTLIELVVRTTDEISLKDAIQMNSSLANMEAVINQDISSELNYRIQDQRIEFAVSQNIPNPFKEFTVSNVSLPKEGTIKYKVFDLMGRMVFENEIQGSRTIEINIQANDLSNKAGVYTLEVEFEGQYIKRKMILMN